MDMATRDDLGLVWMGPNDMLMQQDHGEHIFNQQPDGTFYTDGTQSLQSLEDMRPPLGIDGFVSVEDYDSYCGEEAQKFSANTYTQASQTGTRKIRAVKHPGLRLKTPIAYESDTDPSVIPIQKDGMARCQKCGAIGVKHAFYTKERRFCSMACARGSGDTSNDSQVNNTNNSLKPDQNNQQIMHTQPISQIQPTMAQQLPQQMAQQLQMQPQMQLQQQMQVLMQPQMQQIQPGLETQMMASQIPQQVQMQIQPMQQLQMAMPQMEHQLQLPMQTMQLQAPMDVSHMQMNMQMQMIPQQMQIPQPQMHVQSQMQIQSNNQHIPQPEEMQMDKHWSGSDSKSDDSLSSLSLLHQGTLSPLPPLELDEPMFPPDKRNCPDLLRTYEWDAKLSEVGFMAAPVSCFQHAPMSDSWDNITVGMKVEVQNTDCDNCSENLPDSFWVATVLKISGYKALLRYEGFGQNNTKDFWVNLCSSIVHHVGWCAIRGRPLIPPKTVEHKYTDWKDFLVKRLTGARTLPSNFYNKVHESLKSRFRINQNVEVVDKNRISQVKVATIENIIGKRLHVRYHETDDDDNGFWCHEDSPLIHPVGWAIRVGHEIDAPSEYVERCALNQWDEDDATVDLFPQQIKQQQIFAQTSKSLSNSGKSGFCEGMKLEAIDPLNLSSICVATVMKVLREGYIMIRIDSYDADVSGSDWFCYHQTSACILPAGFCQSNAITLTPPKGYDASAFSWSTYLERSRAMAAPQYLFRQDIPHHGFVEHMHLEATDIMDPRLVCVATISRVVGRLLKVHFDGWEEEYDQWLDCNSSDVYPVGWCQLVSHKLEAPRVATPPKPNQNTGRTHRGVRSRRGRRGMHKRRGPGAMKKSPGETLSLSHIPSMTEIAVPMLAQVDSHTDVVSGMPVIEPVAGVVPAGPGQTLRTSSERAPPAQIINVSEPPVEIMNNIGSTWKMIPRLIDTNTVANSDSRDLNPSQWDVNDVAQFLRVNDCAAYCENFAKQNVDGKALLNLTKDEIMDLTGMKVGPSLKISDLIQQLRIKVNPAQERAKASLKKLL